MVLYKIQENIFLKFDQGNSIKNVLTYLFIFSIIISLTGCFLEDPCSIIVTFSDSNLEAVIRNKIHKTSGDIYLCDVNSIGRIDANYDNISLSKIF